LKQIKPAKLVNRKKAALKRLGVTDLQLREAAEISDLLKQAKGGLTGTLQAMRFSQNSDVVNFLEKYNMLPDRDRRSLPWEAIALAAGVDIPALLGGAILAIQSYSANAVKLIALSHHPEITKARIAYGLLPGGERDRTAIDTALRFLPSAKGSTIIFNAGGKSEEKDDEEDDEREEDLEHIFPNLIATQESLVPVKARLLEAGV
jgi:hypothetical protein